MLPYNKLYHCFTNGVNTGNKITEKILKHALSKIIKKFLKSNLDMLLTDFLDMHWGYCSHFTYEIYSNEELTQILNQKLEWVFQDPTVYIPFNKQEKNEALQTSIVNTCRDRFNLKNCAIDRRLFATMEEIDNKILTTEYDSIIFYTLNWKYYVSKKKDKISSHESFLEFYLIHKKPNSDAIYYKDVLEEVGKCGGFHFENHWMYLRGIEKSESDDETKLFSNIPAYHGRWIC